MWSYLMYFAGYGEADVEAPRNEEVTNQEQSSSNKNESDVNKLEPGRTSGEESDGYYYDSSSGAEYLPHDHGLYGPTSKAIFKKQYVERKFGLLKKPSLNTPMIKFTLALTQLCIIIDAALFYGVLEDHAMDIERVVEKLLTEDSLENLGGVLENVTDINKVEIKDYMLNPDCLPWIRNEYSYSVGIIIARISPFLIDIEQHMWWSFLVFSILIPQYLNFNTAMQVLGKDCPTVWSFFLMMSALIIWVIKCVGIKSAKFDPAEDTSSHLDEDWKFQPFRTYTNCHIYLGYMLHAFFVIYAATVIIHFIANTCPTIYRIRVVGKALKYILPALKSDVLLTFPLVTEVFVTASGHYSVQFYSMTITAKRTDKEMYAKEEARLTWHIVFHLGTCFCLLLTEFLKHKAVFHNKHHLIDRKTFKENFMQFVPMYKPGGPLGGPPHTWTDDWMVRKKATLKRRDRSSAISIPMKRN